MINTTYDSTKTMFLNSKGKNIDPKSIEKHINDTIGNNPDNAVDYIDDLGQRITMSKKVFMGILNSVYKMDTSISKQDFVNTINKAGVLKDGLVNSISKDELLIYMSQNSEVSTTHDDLNIAFNSLHKVGVKLTKEELLELMQKNMEDNKASLQAIQKSINLNTKELFEYQKDRQVNPTPLEQLLAENKGSD